MQVRIREQRPDEQATVLAVFDGLSTESRYRRYHAPIPRLTPGTLGQLAAVDGHDHVAFVAETGRGRRRRPVGLARMVRTGPDAAELAIEVVDEVQGRGVGRRLLERLRARATQDGLRWIEATVLADNEPMLHLLRSVFPGGSSSSDGHVRLLRAPVGVPALTVDDVLPALAAAA